jgi:hypothetical protein
MANEQNLKPIQKGQLSNEELKKRQRNGGLKSVQVRRERKLLREEILSRLSNGKTQDEIIDALIEKAKIGDMRAFELLRDTIGEKPTDRHEVLSKGFSVIVQDEETKNLIDSL